MINVKGVEISVESGNVIRTETTETTCSPVEETEEICFENYCVDYDSVFNETSGDEEIYCVDLRENYCRTNTIKKQHCTMYESKGIIFAQNSSGDWVKPSEVFKITKDSDDLTFHYNGIKGDFDITFETGVIYNGNYHSMAEVKGLYPEIEFNFPTQKYDTHRKYAVNISNIPLNKSKIENITFTYKSHNGFTLDQLIKANDRYNIKEIMSLKFYDLLESGFTFNINKDEKRIYISNITEDKFDGDSLYLDPTIWVYQEDADETACGGNWKITSPCSNVYDGDWNTYGYADSPSPNNSYIYLNYTKQGGALNSSLWQVKDGDGLITNTNNLTLNINCWNQNVLQFRGHSFNHDGIEDWINWSCWNGSDYFTLREHSGNAYYALYEEAMNWNYTDSGNITISKCTVLSEDSGHYYLDSDITDSTTSNCMDITANNVILDCQGHTIDSTDGTYDYGIRILRASPETTNVTIKNCILTDWDSSGIYLYFADKNRLDNITSNSNTDYGVYLSNSDFNNITDITANSNDYGIISGSNGNDNTLTNISVSSNIYGISIGQASSRNLLTNITASSNTNTGIQIYNSQFTTIENSVLSDNTIFDLRMQPIIFCNHRFINVNGTNNKQISFFNQTKVTLENINNMSEIILCNLTEGSVVNNLTLEKNGLIISRTNSTTIKNSNFTDTYWIHLYSSHNNFLENISVTSGTYGVRLDNSDNNTIIGSNFTSGSSNAISYTNNPEENIIYNNFFNQSVSILGGTGTAYWNTTKQEGWNVYDNNPYIGGNFYANPTGTGQSETCTDANYDGFCDSSYTLATDNIDYLPLSDEYIAEPFFEPIDSFSKDEDFGNLIIDVSDNVTDSTDSDSDLKFTWTNNDTSILTIDIVNATDEVNFTSVANQTGSVDINLSVWDTDGNQNSTKFTLTINSINDNPWKNGTLSNVTSTEDIGTITVIANADLKANFSDVEEDGAPTTYELIEQTNTTVKCYFDSNDLKCNSVANQSTSNNIKFSLNDSSGLSIEYDLDVSLTAVNDNPWWDPIINATLAITEDTASQDSPTNASVYYWDVEGGKTFINISISTNETDVPCVNSSEAIQCSPTNNFTGPFIITLNGTDGTLSSILNYEVDVTNVNDPPLFTDYLVINSTNGQNYTPQDLHCRFNAFDVDVPENLYANVSWLKDNVSQFTFQSLSITNGTEYSTKLENDNLTAGDLWNCQVEVCDDEENCTSWVNSTQLTILQNISISSEGYKPDTIYNNVSATLNATILGSLLDTVWIRANYTGSYVNYSNATFGFTHDGNVWSYFVDSGNFTNQDEVNWTYYANDTFGNELAGTTLGFYVENRNATIDSGAVSIIPDPAIDTDTLNCSVGHKYDYDGEAVNFYYTWWNNSVVFQANVDSQNISAGNLTSGDIWQCGVTPYDLYENGTQVKSQLIEIGSSNVGPSLTSTNVTTQGTTIISSSSNPTNNNSAITFYVGFTDSVDALNDAFSAYFCKTDSFTYPDTCDGGEWAKNQSNTTRTVYSGDFTITSSETLSSYNFYSFVTDNDTVSASLSGTFNVNHPPDNPNLTIVNETKYNTEDINLTFTTSDSDSDTITSYIYIDQGSGFDLNGTTTNQGFNFTNFPDAKNYTWFVESIDEHDFSSDNSSMKFFQTDYTNPSNTISATSYSGTSTGRTATITMSQSDNLVLDSCYYKISSAIAGESPTAYTLTTCNSNINLNSTNLPEAATYTVYVKANDTFNNINESSVVFTTSISTEAAPGAGGGAVLVLATVGLPCETNEECASGICDLEQDRIGRTSETYQTCVDVGGLCGNRICSIEVKDEEGNIIAKLETYSTCFEDCAAFRIPEELTPFIRYLGIAAMIALTVVLSSETEFAKKYRKKFHLPKYLQFKKSKNKFRR